MAIYDKVAKAEGGEVIVRVKQLESQEPETRIRKLKPVLGQIQSVLTTEVAPGPWSDTGFTMVQCLHCSAVFLSKRNSFGMYSTKKIPIGCLLHFPLSLLSF